MQLDRRGHWSRDLLVEMKTIIERETQGEPDGDQSKPTDGAARTAAVLPSSELYDGEGVVARREGGIPAQISKYNKS